MAITASIVYSGNGPSATGQIIAQRDAANPFGRTFYGRLTLTLDGAATTATVNYIDGVQVLGFAPAIFISQKAAVSTSSQTLSSLVDGGNNGLSATATVSAAGTNGQTVVYDVLFMKPTP